MDATKTEILARWSSLIRNSKSHPRRLKWRTHAAIVATTLCVASTASGQTALDTYVAEPDPAYSWSLAASTPGNGYTRHVIDLTSQIWRTSDEVNRTAWRHWLDVIIPDGAPISTAMLHLGGGFNGGASPRASASLIGGALDTNSVMAQLYTVPNQSLSFSDENRSRAEDEIIAYTMDRFLDGADDQWPVLLPMVKSAVRAMDTVQELVANQTQGTSAVDDFTVYGVSKRGWTSWLTAAVDSRVRAIVPTVFDFLSFEEQLPHHNDFYESVTDQIVGGYSWTLHDYVDSNVIDRLPTGRGRELQEIVDPYQFRDRYENIPTLVINATGDEFSVPDASQFYFDDLPGEKYLRYVPNSNHRGHFETAVQFHQAITTDVELPEFDWSIEDGGRRIEVTTEDTPLEVKLWQAQNPNARDFRHSISTPPPVWQATLLSDQGDGRYVAEVPNPESGASAFMVELAFDSGGATPFLFTTDISVIVPQTAALAGDYNDSRLVEQNDLDLVLLNWGSDFTALPSTWVNQRPSEGIVDQTALDGVLLNWGNSSTLALQGVPEPSTLLLAGSILGLLAAQRYGRFSRP